MENSLIFLLLILLVVLNTITKPFSASGTTQLNPNSTDREALLEFKNNIISDPNGRLSESWNSGNTATVCRWVGVSCGRKHPERVTSLDLSGLGLAGTLPPHLGNLTFLSYFNISFNHFTGALAPEMSRLRRLRVLDVGHNSFTSEIPSWAGALPQLRQLVLMNNTFLAGALIPPSLFSNNSRLQRIDMSYCSLSGSIPQEFVGNCSSLEILNLNANHLTGVVPSGMFDNLPRLKRLGLSLNQIEGRIPTNIRKCRNLEVVSLSLNRFNGNIPTEIASLTMLRHLYLGYNDFKGGIPEELGNLSRLEILSIPAASLTGLVPKQIANCTSLNQLDLGDNYYLTGELPQEFANLQFLEVLIMFNNSMSGSIPSSIFNVSSLWNLDLSSNQFSGNLILPLEFPTISNLEELYLVRNMLTGPIPNSITNASMLTNLELAMNSFSGPVPNFGNARRLRILQLWDNNLTSPGRELGFLSSLTNCPLLQELVISGNPLRGVLPTSIGNLSTYLYLFGAEHNDLTGVIPYSIANLSSLRDVALIGNQLTGPIPPTLRKLKQLQRLYLNSNRLQGQIPPDLCLASRIGELNLNDNAFTGPIPRCLGNVQSLRSIDLGSNKLSSDIPSSFWNLKDLLLLNLSSNYLSGQLSVNISSLKGINTLDLSHNNFSGIILTSIDGCQSLGFLSLSNNELQGFIPASLGGIRGLSTLDLSNNNLSGSIPKSLQSLDFLQHFNMSYNKLEGEIPTGGRFINFTARSFLNNSALCGGATALRVQPCPIKKNIRTSKGKKSDRLMEIILPPVSVIVLATIIVLVVLTRRRRKIERVQTQTDIISAGANLRRVSYLELARGTHSFSETNLLGRGSFGSVFKATLSDGLNVAVKVFDLQSERVSRSFVTECEILSSIRHRNLVRIIGCCSNTEFKALIFGYMTNGSLDERLHSENYCMDLIQRLGIAIDVALALEYLHHGHTFPVVHCDVKPSNVLLDEELVAHLADFGISKLLEGGETTVITKTLATIGYAAPEYGSEGKVSTNGDVYSYGILLLEMFTGKKPTDEVFNEEMSLREWTLRALQENAVSEVVAPGLLSGEDPHLHAKEEECVSSVFTLAMKCLAISPEQRISMIEVASALHKIKATAIGGGSTRRQQHGRH